MKEPTATPRSVVYAFRASGLVKIGRTTNLPKRFSALQHASPVALVLLGWGYGGHAFETSLHRQFARRRKHGEWFQLAPADERLLKDRLMGKPEDIGLPAIARQRAAKETKEVIVQRVEGRPQVISSRHHYVTPKELRRVKKRR